MDARLDNAPCGYFSITDAGIIREVNQTLLNMLQHDNPELAGRHVESVLSVTNKLLFHTYFYPHIQLYGQVNEMYMSLRTNSGGDVPVLLNGIRRTRDGESRIDIVVVEMRKRIEHEKDVLQTKVKLQELYQATNEANKRLELLNEEYERKQQELMLINSRLEAMATTDPLTGLRNRRYFQDHLTTLLAKHQNSGQPLSMLIIDIDHFKNINDTYGHPIGDIVLAKLAELLQSMSRETDIIARFGGEEFVAILPETGKEQAVDIAEALCRATAATPMDDYRITISLGVATAEIGETNGTLVKKADTALYASKSGGRNRVTHAGDL
ncbi:sensor domain-containing diguanylate cyclase [Paenibacillus agaridevorans]|uniref:sensor domain-containing diguanylate cyclase n=1 Tax=Paenibacillus agaridevorans TaxID=171404 RepID=UPI001BE47320|nr:diguanylate cyclase [Paenibacillus agaridevorans]